MSVKDKFKLYYKLYYRKKIRRIPSRIRIYLCSLLNCNQLLRINKPLLREGKEWNSGFMAGLSESFFADVGQAIMAWSHVEEQFNLLYLSAIVMEDKGTGSMSTP